MKTQKNEATDQVTKDAWKKNWQDIPMEKILEIFFYERVQKQMEIFLRVLPKGEKILEGGCGLAPYLIRLRQLGFDVEGIDYNEDPIAKVLAYDPSLPVKVGDVTAIPYPDAYFGGYISLGVIEHFTAGPQQAIREAHRVLKPGAVFVVAVPQNHLFMKLMAPLRWLKRNQVLRKLFGRPADSHYWEQYFHRNELRAVLEKEGFDVQEINPLDHAAAVISFSNIFRDKTTFDEANRVGLAIGRWCEKYMPWATAAQIQFVCYKRT
ncbi:MAG TPA: methyltransferase domain-containing protein [Candidatus Omnitrophota bacterium]|nr:methyltransferase domain-containing protein [Candidatus Omnitrophota bacterium]